LDTNICIYIHRRQPAEVLTRFQKLKPGDVAISVITWGELLYVTAKSRRRKQARQILEEFKTIVPVLPMAESVGEAYGSLRAALESKGTPIGNNDLWIAAHAVAGGMILVTNNEREFRRVPGLKVQNWVG
jgi:tRNA(fMet)-specific endonuclease VapC